MNHFDKILIIIGAFLILLGLIIGGKVGPLGRLPGDFYISGDNYTFYFPLTTGIILSLIASFIFWLFNRFFK